MTHSRTLGRALFALALLCAVSIPAAAAVAGLKATLSMDKSYVGRGERALATLTLTNDSGADVYIARWQTPFQGIQANIFDVRRDGLPVAYLGVLAKRTAPGPRDFEAIPAGAQRSVRVDLSQVYDMSRTGEYSVRYRVSLQDAMRDAAPVAITDLAEISSNVEYLGVERDDRAPRFEAPARIGAAAGSNTFVKCNASQQGLLVTARGNAGTYSGGAISYLAGNTAGPRYTTWFGTYTSSRFNTVKNHYNAIKPVFDNAAMTFDCGCKQKHTYAFVYPNQPYEIHLCGAFWQAPATGTDSKAGTLVHETSHFTVVAGTDDHAYGQTACKSLAISNPDFAVDNADSHEYFAENTPPLN